MAIEQRRGADFVKAKEVIERKIDPKYIKKRDTGFGKPLDYISGSTVIRLLNEAFGLENWSFEIVDEKIVESLPKPAYDGWGKNKKPKLDSNGNQLFEPQAPYVQIKGKLTVMNGDTLIIKEQYGTKILVGGASEQEGAAKSAGTDALKKCATLFGVGLELYEDEVSPEVTASYNKPDTTNNDYNRNETKTYNTYTKPAAPVQVSKPFDDNEVQRLKELKAILGAENNTQLNPFVQEFTGNPSSDYMSVTPDNIAAFNKFLQTKASNI